MTRTRLFVPILLADRISVASRLPSKEVGESNVVHKDVAFKVYVAVQVCKIQNFIEGVCCLKGRSSRALFLGVTEAE